MHYTCVVCNDLSLLFLHSNVQYCVSVIIVSNVTDMTICYLPVNITSYTRMLDTNYGYIAIITDLRVCFEVYIVLVTLYSILSHNYYSIL